MKRLNKSFLFLASSLYVTFKYLWSEELMLWCFVSNNTKTLFRFERALWKETCVYVRNACIDCVSSCGRMLVLGWVLVFRRWELPSCWCLFSLFLYRRINQKVMLWAYADASLNSMYCYSTCTKFVFLFRQVTVKKQDFFVDCNLSGICVRS